MTSAVERNAERRGDGSGVSAATMPPRQGGQRPLCRNGGRQTRVCPNKTGEKRKMLRKTLQKRQFWKVRTVLYCTRYLWRMRKYAVHYLVKTKADGKTLLQYSSLSSNHAFVARRGCPLSHCCAAQRAAAVIIVPDINSRCGIGFPSELGEEKDRRP